MKSTTPGQNRTNPMSIESTNTVSKTVLPVKPVSTKEAASILNVSEQTIRKFLRIGRLTRLPDIARNRITPESIATLLR